jgi:hypothetical protein
MGLLQTESVAIWITMLENVFTNRSENIGKVNCVTSFKTAFKIKQI